MKNLLAATKRETEQMSPTERAAYDEARFARAEDGGRFRPVSRDQFFAAVGAVDVHPQIQPGPYPWESHWKTPERHTLGKTVDYRPDGHRGRIATKYFARA